MINTSIDIGSVKSGDEINSSARQAEFSHDNEIAKAHYYSVTFDEGSNASNSQIEVTPTLHGAVSRFTFDKDSKNRNIIFDSTRASGTLKYNKDGSFEATSNHTSNGMQTMYVYGEFSEKPVSTIVQNSKQGIASFDSDVVELKLATSFISIDQAKKNLELEIGKNDDFKSIFKQAQNTWDETLNTIDVKGASKDQLITLYSNLYRLNAYPNLLSENTGTNDEPVWKYKSPYGNHDVVDGTLYYNNGFWDTYRTAWAAYGLFTPEKATELLDGLVQHYNDQGYVPRWIAPGGTNSMVGTSSDIIFGDAIAKGIEFDWQNAYESAIKNAAVAVDSSNLTNGGRAQLNTSIFEGYTAHNIQHEGFSWSIEGYINDYGVYKLAKKLGYEDEAAYYLNRALNYSKLFKSTGDSVEDKWLRGKNANGDWSYSDEEFNPFFWGDDYTETNAFNMSVSVPHDGQGLANLYGGRAALGEKLDTIFETNGDYWGYGAEESIGGIHEQKEAREIKLGQYGHSNQPSHHIPYMYNYAGQPWKTQKYVRDILDRAYVGSDLGQGYIGDEDNGEMSAWYIFSALGFYPVSMGNDEYAIGSPLFDEITVHLDNGKDIKVIANNNSDENIYIQSMKLNGKEYNKNYIKHSDIASGATIEFEMGSTPNTNWGSSENSLPTSITDGDELPDPLEDVTITSVKEISYPNSSDLLESLYSNVTESKNLFDNNSNTASILNESGKSEVIYTFGKPTKISIMTLTSGRNGSAPSGYILSGSHDGENWKVIDERDELEFEWQRYTRPFKLPEENCEGFIKYKVELIGGETLAEIELLGQEGDTSSIDKDTLNKLIINAKVIDQSNMTQAAKELLNNAIKSAEEVVNNESSTQEEIINKYLELKNVIDRVNSIRIAKSRIEAEEFNSAHSDIVNDGDNIGGVKKNTWAKYNDIAFEGNEDSLELYYSAQKKDAGGYVEVYIDGMEGDPIAKIDVPITGDNWSTYVLAEGNLIKDVEPGLHDIYLVFKNDTDTPYVSNVDYFRFGNKIDANVNVIGEGSVRENCEGFIKYKVELIGGETLAEIELLGQEGDTSTIDKDTLNKLIINAKVIDQSNMTKVAKELLNNAIKSAEEVVNNESSTQEEIINKYLELKKVIDRVNSIRIAKNRIEAEEFSSAHSDIVNDGENIGGVKKNTWAKYNDIAFDGNEDSLELYYSAQKKDAGGYVEVYIDGMEGDPIAKIDVPITGDNWSTYVLAEGNLIKDVEPGLHDIYLVFRNDTDTPYVSNVDYFRFGNKIDANVNVIGEGSVSEGIAYEGRPYTITFDGEVSHVFVNCVEVEFDKAKNSYTIDNLTSETEIVVVFGDLVPYKIITEVQNGDATVELSKSEATGYEEVSLIIKDIEKGKVLSSVKLNGEEQTIPNSVDGGYTIKLVMPFEDAKVEVILEDKVEMMNVKVNPSENGEISTSAIDNQIAKGDDLVISIIPNEGYRLESLIINGNDMTSLVESNKLVYKSVSEDLEISSKFVINTNKEELQRIINLANDVVEKGFLEGVSKEIVDEFNNALAVAKNINNNSNSNQEDISKASIDLMNSIKKVIEFERVNKDELRQYVGDIENIDLSVYTESTVAEFTKALKNARDVLNNELATQEEVDKALSDLKVTKGSLTKKETESTVAEFTKALKNARDVLNNELATQEEVDKALSDLKVTKGSLTKKEENTNKENGESEKPGGINSDSSNSLDTPKTGDVSSISQYIYAIVSAGGGLYLLLKGKRES